MQSTRHKTKLLALLTAGLLCVLAGIMLLLPQKQVSASEEPAPIAETSDILASAHLNLDFVGLTTNDNGETLQATFNIGVPTSWIDRINKPESTIITGGLTSANFSYGYVVLFATGSNAYSGVHEYTRPYYTPEYFGNSIYAKKRLEEKATENTYINYKNAFITTAQNDNKVAFMQKAEYGENGFTASISVPKENLNDLTFYAIYVDKYDYKLLNTRYEGWSITGLSDAVTNVNKTYIENYIQSEDVDLENIEQYSNVFKACQKVLDIRPVNDISHVKLEYLKMKGFSEYETVQDGFYIDSSFIHNPTIVKHLASQTFGYGDNLTKFNAIYKDYSYHVDGQANLLSQKIVRQAVDVEYDLNNIVWNNGEASSTLKVVYDDFNYADFSIRIKNNDVNNALIMDIYTTTVTPDGENYILSFNYDEITQQLYNSCGWLFELTPDNFNIINNSNDVIVDLGADAVTFTFPKNNQEALFDVSATATTIITEDLDYSVVYKYMLVNSDLTLTEITSAPFALKYSKLINLSNQNFYALYGEEIETALSPDVLGDARYIEYSGTRTAIDTESSSAIITVLYNYNTIVKTTNNLNGEVRYANLKKNVLNYTASEFDFCMPDGYRIKNLSCLTPDLATIEFKDVYPANSTIKVLCGYNCQQIIEVYAELSDKYPVKINYMTQYKTNTPFFIKAVFEDEVRVADYENIYEISTEQLLAIMRKESFDLLGLATIDSFSVRRELDTYIIDVEYCNASLKSISADGTDVNEVRVFLTTYADWCAGFGKDWSVFMLNTPKNTYFQYSNEIDPADLYGFFSVAVFEEQVKNLQDHFATYSADGCKTVFQSKKVVGSEIYKFFAGLNFEIALEDDIGMWFCEIANDDNKTLHSYFFYLDGTSTLAYMGLNGADSYDDTDTTIKNRFEDAGDAISTFFKDAFKKAEDFFQSDTGKVVKIILITVLCVAVLVLFVYLGIKFGWLRRRR